MIIFGSAIMIMMIFTSLLIKNRVIVFFQVITRTEAIRYCNEYVEHCISRGDLDAAMHCAYAGVELWDSEILREKYEECIELCIEEHLMLGDSAFQNEDYRAALFHYEQAYYLGMDKENGIYTHMARAAAYLTDEYIILNDPWSAYYVNRELYSVTYDQAFLDKADEVKKLINTENE